MAHYISPANNGSKINKKLQDEREKARELLEKSQSPMRGNSERISHLFRPSRSNETPQGSTSRQYNLSINISDLAEDKTEDLGMSQKFTFDPSEITGRSTMLSKHDGKGVSKKKSSSPVEENFDDILGTSRFQHVRDLRTSYRESCGRNLEGTLCKNREQDFDEIFATSLCQNVRDFSKTYRESHGSGSGRNRMESLKNSDRESFHSDDFVSSDNMKRNMLSEDERDWEKEFFAVPGRKKTTEIPVDYEGFSGFFVPHNTSYASDQFSLGALCHKQSEAVNNMIRADSPTPAATCMLSSTVNSVTSAYSEAPSAAGRTYTAESKETDVDSLIENLNLSESTNKILANMLKKEPKKNIRKSPLDDITAQEVNLNSTEGTINESTLQSGKENRQSDKEYEDFCRFKTKSPRRAGSNSKLSLSTESAHEKSKRRSSSSRLEPFAEQTRGTRKRSRSSVYIQSDPAPSVVECRRGKSPGNTEKTRMNSDVGNSALSLNSIDPTSASDRMFIFNTPIDSGKMSLPNYGLIKGDSKSPGSTGLTRTTSQLSTASEFNHREGYLPLKATHGELSWGSVRLRTSITKNIQIKNTSAKRLTLRAVIDGPGFQFGSAELPHMTITLQPQECRGMWIVFCPTIKGPAVGKLIFKPPLADSTSRVIPLYGYGGHATVTIEGLQQGPVGSKFLPIGDIKNPMRTFEKIIRVHNKGSLTAFASVNVENTRTDQRYFTTSVSVNPSRLIVPPSCSTNIKIQFSPQREELKKLLKMQRGTDVIVIANLVVITGDEPTRHRMKKLMKTMPNHALMSSTVLSGLWNSFPKEQDLENLEELRENSMAITDLAQGFRSIEIALTINNERADETVLEASGWMADFEETVLFRTITSGEEPDEHEVTHDEVEVVSVQPQEIVWKSHDAACKRLTVKSLSGRPQMVEIDTNYPHLVEILPSRREILPRDTLTVLLRFLPEGQMPKKSFIIRVQVAHQNIMIPVKIV